MRIAEGASSRTGAPASVTVYTDARAALPAWRELAAAAPSTPYQEPAWVLPWLDTIGASLGIAPFIVVARDADGRPTALLPLGLQRQGSLAVASFLGAKNSNFNMSLFRPGIAWSRAAIEALLRRAALEAGTGPDLFVLRNQPLSWQGCPNPFTALQHQPSPSFAYKTTLDADPETFLKAHLSRDSRKKLRQKMNRLRGLGPVRMADTSSGDDVAIVLDAFMAQRTARNRSAGLGCDDLPAMRRFLDATVGRGGPVSFFALLCGDRVVATLGGVRHGTRFSGMLTSFTAEPDIARTSPGELLLGEVMTLHGAAGFTAFDLGIGEARYKESYCPDVEELFDSLVPVSVRGHLVARLEGLRLQAKRAIKQSPWAWPLAQRVRRARAALAARPWRVSAAPSGGLPDEAARHED